MWCGLTQVRLALVTEKIVPMQFTGPTTEMLDLITDYELLGEAMIGQ